MDGMLMMVTNTFVLNSYKKFQSKQINTQTLEHFRERKTQPIMNL